MLPSPMSRPIKVVFFHIVVNFAADCFGLVVHFTIDHIGTFNGFPQVFQFDFFLALGFCGVIIPFTQDCVNLIFQRSNLCIVPSAFLVPGFIALVKPDPQLRVCFLSSVFYVSFFLLPSILSSPGILRCCSLHNLLQKYYK